jgi:DNA-binding MarR family transcriptional regulator
VKYLPDTVSNETDVKLMQTFLQFNHLYRFNEPHDISNDGNTVNKRKCGKLRFSQIMLLFYIKFAVKTKPDGVSASELSVLMNVKPPTINPLLTDLEKLDLIKRKPDHNDRRFVRIELTPTGIEFTQEHQKVLLKRIHGLACYLGNEKSNNLIELVNEVYTYFSNQCN